MHDSRVDGDICLPQPELHLSPPAFYLLQFNELFSTTVMYSNVSLRLLQLNWTHIYIKQK